MPPNSEWHHSPSHLFVPGVAYIVTAGTYQKKYYFASPSRLSLLQSMLFQQAERYGWQLEAWAVVSNHYHVVAIAPNDPKTLSPMIRQIHSKSARAVNAEDGTPARRVWFEYWDTCLTDEKSYYTRLHYVHTNPVKHHLADKAEDYPWCSMRWFLANADRAFSKQVLSFKLDRVSVKDDF